jgi:hypothetical protein
VETAKKSQVGKTIKIILATNTEALKIETTNKFETKSPRSAQTINLFAIIDVETVRKDKSVKAVKTGSRTPSPNWLSTRGHQSSSTGSPLGLDNEEEDIDEVTSSRRLTINNPQHLPHYHH